MTPRKLRLKNFIGIKHGMRLDELTLDLTTLPEGIIVFDAITGRGKTTILDNLHAYRLMPYSSGKTYRPTAFSYYDHCIDDAEKVFEFQIGQTIYRSIIKIDVKRKKQEAFLQVMATDGASWVPCPGVDGKLEAYDHAIEELCGSPELFFTSIFRAQQAKAVSDYSKGDMKQIFIELLGIDRLQEIAEKARRVRQFVDGRLELRMQERANARDVVAKEAETQAAITATTQEIAKLAGEISAAEERIRSIQGEINGLDVKIGLQTQARETLDRVRAELVTKQAALKVLTDRREAEYKDLTDRRAGIALKLTRAAKLTGILSKLRADADVKTTKETLLDSTKSDIKVVDDELVRLNQELADILRADNQIKDKENALASAAQKRKSALAAAQRELADAKKQDEYIKNSRCPIDNPTCTLMEAAVAKRDRIGDIEREIVSYGEPSAEETALQADIDELKAKRTDPASIRSQIKVYSDTKAALLARQQPLEKEIQGLSASILRLPLAEQAREQLADLRKEAKRITDELMAYAAATDDERKALQAAVDELTRQVADATDTGPDYAQQKKDLTTQQVDVQKEIDDARARDATHRQTLGGLEETLRQVEKAKEDLTAANAQIEYLNGESTGYSLLEQAFGPDGIIALEIDDAGPQVSTRANQLLQVFGGRYMVRIETQAAKASGKGQSETLDIIVTDTEVNEEKSIKRMSGGQRSLIEEAVTKGICLYNKGASGLHYDTIFTDEKDSAFDMELRKEYFQMKRTVLSVGGFQREFCITHTPDLKAMADAVISLKEGGAEVIINQ